MTYLQEFLFGIYPYICAVVFIVGSALRYDRAQYSWKTSSSQVLSNKDLIIGSNLFHVGIILLLSGHFVGLLTPHALYGYFITAGQKQLLAMVAGGVFGTICFIGLTILLVRRLFNQRIRATSRFSDIMILVVLYVQLILGLCSITVSAHHLDGSSMLRLAHWAQDIVVFHADAARYVLPENWIFKVHIVLGCTILLLFPFTRLVHVWSLPLGYLHRPGYQVVRSKRIPRN